jgi:hypothetical protein
MANDFDQSRMSFTDAAHRAALEQAYPVMFEGLSYRIEDVAAKEGNRNTRTEAFDFYLGIDSIVHFNKPGIEPMILTVQERFREPQYQPYQDITITAGNNKTHQNGESKKLAAQLFLYGYYDQTDHRILDVIAVDVMMLVMALQRSEIKATRNNGNQKEQPFIAIEFADLYRCKAVAWHLGNREKWNAIRMLAALHDRVGAVEQAVKDFMPELLRTNQEIVRLLLRANSTPRSKKTNNDNVIPFPF